MKYSEKSTKKSSASHARLDKDSRLKKANNIIRILGGQSSLNKKQILDIGTGAGTIAAELAKLGAIVTSVDIFDERIDKKGYKFLKVENEVLPLDDEIFDYVLSNHVVEHTPDRKKHLSEALRVLKKNGKLYLATPNQHWITDPHYNLPFIPWIPRKLAQKYLKIFRGSDAVWDIYPTSTGYIKSNTSGASSLALFPEMIDTLSENSDKLSYKIISKIPKSIQRKLQRVSPTLLFLITK